MTRVVIPVQLFNADIHTKVNDVVYKSEAEALAACEDAIEEPEVNEDPTTTPRPIDPTDPTPWTPPGTGGGGGGGDDDDDDDGDGDGSGGGDGDGDGSGGGDGDGSGGGDGDDDGDGDDNGNGSGSAPPPINTNPQPPITNTPGGPLAPPMLPNPPPTLGDPSSCQTCVHDSQVISTGGEAIGDGVGERCRDGCYCEVDPDDPFWDSNENPTLLDMIKDWIGGLIGISDRPDRNKARGGIVHCPDQGTISCCCPEGYKSVPYDRESKNCTDSCDVTKYYYCVCYDGFGTTCTVEDKQFCEAAGGTFHQDPLNPNNDPASDEQNCGCEWGAWGTDTETILKITPDDQPIDEDEPGYDPNNPYCPQGADSICQVKSNDFVYWAGIIKLDPCKLDKGPDNFDPNNPSASMDLSHLP